MSQEAIKEHMEKFKSALSEHGDMFFESGSIDQDYERVRQMVKHQGYWAGVGLRFFFDENFNLSHVEERRFG